MGFARTATSCSRYSRHSAGCVELCPCWEGGARRGKVIIVPLKSTKVQADNSTSSRPPAELVNSSARVPTRAGGFHRYMPNQGYASLRPPATSRPKDVKASGTPGQQKTPTRHVLAGELEAYSKVPVPGHPGWSEPVSGAGRGLLNKPP
jgi:hypothetical protein